MFYNCVKLNSQVIFCDETISCPDGFYPSEYSGAEDCTSMFEGCSTFNQLTVLPLSVKKCNRAFANCVSLNSQVLLREHNLEDCSEMFEGCTGLDSITFTIPSTVKEYKGMFKGCTSPNIHVTIYSNYVDPDLIIEGSNITQVEKFNLSEPPEWEPIKAITRKYVEKYEGVNSYDEADALREEYLKEVLAACNASPEGIEIPEREYSLQGDTLTLYSKKGLWNYCSDNNIFCGNFNQPVVLANTFVDADYLFQGCTSFNQPVTLPLSLRSCSNMFSGCASFNQPLRIPPFAQCCSVLNNCLNFNSGFILSNGAHYGPVSPIKGITPNFTRFLDAGRSPSSSLEPLFNGNEFKIMSSGERYTLYPVNPYVVLDNFKPDTWILLGVPLKEFLEPKPGLPEVYKRVKVFILPDAPPKLAEAYCVAFFKALGIECPVYRKNFEFFDNRVDSLVINFTEAPVFYETDMTFEQLIEDFKYNFDSDIIEKLQSLSIKLEWRKVVQNFSETVDALVPMFEQVFKDK